MGRSLLKVCCVQTCGVIRELWPISSISDSWIFKFNVINGSRPNKCKSVEMSCPKFVFKNEVNLLTNKEVMYAMLKSMEVMTE